MTCASCAAESSQSGRSWPSSSAIAIAQRSEWQIDDEPVRSANDHGVPSAWRAQRISPRCLQLEHEVDGALDDRPQALDEPPVSGHEPPMPHARGDVRAHVGVELVVLDAVGQVVLMPRAVGPLTGDEPVERALRLVMASAERQRHGGLDVVPRVRVPAGNHGIMPFGSCHAAMASIVARTSASLIAPRTLRSRWVIGVTAAAAGLRA